MLRSAVTLPHRPVARPPVRARLALLPLALWLAGCAAVLPPSQLPALQARHAPLAQPAAQAMGPMIAPNRAWWTELDDAQLDGLVALATARNLDIRASVATVQEARALAGLARSDGGPQGSLSAQGQWARPSQPEVDPYRQGLPRPPEQRLISVGQVLSWELDLFGRVATAQGVAERQLDAAQADAQAAQAAVQAEVVRHYVGLRRAQQGLLLSTQQQAAALQRVSQLQVRVSAGLADLRELEAAVADAAALKAAGAAWPAQVRGEQDALAVLLGASPLAPGGPLAELAQPAAVPAVPVEASLSLPPDLLARRPDVARADALLRASLGEAVLAQRAHLPRLSLAASVGLNESPARLGQSGALRYAVGPQLQWDWLDSGRREAREAAARAGQARAWAQFEQTVLRALADGESALQTWSAQSQAWQQAETAALAAERSARHTSERARLGLEPATAAAQAELQRLQAAQQRLDQQAQAVLAYAQVQWALAAWQP